jgi:hypothetical protein
MRTLLLITISVWLSGCVTAPSNEDETDNIIEGQQRTTANVVWADDDSELALVTQVNDPTDPQRIQHQIIVQKLDGSDRKTISDVRSGKPDRLYYMKKSGYIITRTQKNGITKADKINLAGKEITILETRHAASNLCEQGEGIALEPEIIPSPDGETLALIFSQACNEVTVEFSRAKNLQAIDGYSLEIDQAVTATWHSSGVIILASDDGKSAWRTSPNNPPKAATYPHCFNPTTTSSAIAQDGRKVELISAQVNLSDGKHPSFGCQ